MNTTIKLFMETCLTCQRMKSETRKPMGLLMLLPIPEDISTDFITCLPKVRGKSVIIVVVDRLTKFCHLGALLADYTSKMVVDYFIQNIIKLHGIPKSIVSDRDSLY